MPYTMSNAPSKLDKMPDAAKRIWIATFNSVMEADDDEEKANRVAYASVKRDYEQDEEGEWRSKKKAMGDGTALVFKEKSGRLRWVVFSSSSYKDRDGEIVSQAALEQDAERMSATKQYGTLDWWHTPLVIGTCDFSAMHGNISIESGNFTDEWVGERLATAKDLAVSRSFMHPINEPDPQGVYHHIETFSRAILPRGKESNLLTTLVVSREEGNMFEDRVKEFMAKLGGGKAAEQKVEELLAAATDAQKAADAANIEHKEADVAPVVAPEVKDDTRGEKKDDSEFVGAMTEVEFSTMLTKAMTKAFEPLLAEFVASKNAQVAEVKESGANIVMQVGKVIQSQEAFDKRLKALEGEQPRAFRASQDASTVTTDEKLKAAVPQADPYIATFVKNILAGNTPTQ